MWQLVRWITNGGWKEKYAKNTMHAIIKKVLLSEQKTRTLLFLNLAYWPGRLSVT